MTKAENNRRKKILPINIDIIQFLSERGDITFSRSEQIDESPNGKFMGIVELLNKYDLVLAEHVKRERNAQANPTRFQVPYIANGRQNKLI